ncbi:hypothetical protein A2V56_00720 [Candidatus Woesebacteria bacterium RBG_19FT_COMBO_42_9]|uniref:Membrane protein 6-pyruvoyl-tetrahydropterin synthase-related domain-containing protein n=1 Tax=Candidatus Woesebacteria bacterium RBG_16_42_24 TaxID=1802485 RepID=A0A1F7XKC6_9BACT|nr:MAG: hypothetical protein A2V97_00580 [Candidatus Woesebacteria bacterium RBG_16_42_24]OGM16558.1 MAG: hypothetical protein A2V56_00720 [Candidatus Woesebacteria bacterium RBG_19FT_COMBO_42_9]OGM66188.1 MAG: hypothetical protein A2985_00735 [Candidatus Woesebacteria bacterium RIFCSPLOWO2_01_FULL_43_11]
MKIARSVLVGFFRLIYFIPALIVIIFLVYLFGHWILGPALLGSDNANFITHAKWLSDWFPKIPFWYPQQGGGMSFTASYPILNHLIVVFFEKITKLPMAVVFRIWSLVVVALTSVGLYLLGFRLTKNQTVSSLAAIFYLLAPITWIFLLAWGFAAEQLSFVFVPPVFIFITLFLDEYYLLGFTKKAKIFFLLFVASFAILSMAHPLIFTGILMIVTGILIIYPLFNFKPERRNIKKILLVTITSLATVFLLVSYWMVPYFRYQSISSKGAPSEKEIYNFNAWGQNAIYPSNVFSITDKTAAYTSYDEPTQNKSSFAWHNVSFPFIISLLALVGLVGSFFVNRKIFALGIANIIPLSFAIFPNQTYYLLRLPLTNYFLNWRSGITASRFIIPLLAAFGCFTIAYLITFPLELLSKKTKYFVLKYSLKTSFVVLTTVLTLFVAGILLWRFKNWPYEYPSVLITYGHENYFPSTRVDIRNIWRKKVTDDCFSGDLVATKELNPVCFNPMLKNYFWEGHLNKACTEMQKDETKARLPTEITSLCGPNPSLEIVQKVISGCDRKSTTFGYSEVCRARGGNLLDQFRLNILKKDIKQTIKESDLFGEGKELFYKEREILKGLPDDTNTRVDIGTSLGAFMMMEPFYSRMPELPTYYNQATLLKTLWNYEIGIFNQKETVWPQDRIMYELSKYFGLGYAVLSEDLVPLDKFIRTGWERVDKWPAGTFGGLALWKNSEPAVLLQVSTKPVVLVIGQDKVDGYFRIFHLANLGTLSFEDALIVKGGSYVDAYTANDLKKFDAVVLEGYAYKNQKKGWKVLDEYTKSGGALLINTGWQYSSADWQVASTPEFLPIKELKWQEPDISQEFASDETTIIGDVDLKAFSPLVYKRKPWNISTSDKSNLRSWAKVILSANSKPLIAGGKYGAGKVIWLGFDIPGHIGAYGDNEEEIKLYRNLLSYLLENKEGKVLSATFKRNYPDKLEITINESSGQKTAVYWSEAYYPDFKANLVTGGKSEKLQVYKAGPGMTMFILPKVVAGSKIIYEYKTPLTVTMARLVSLVTLVFLISIVVNSKILIYIKTLVLDNILKGKLRKGIIGEHGDEDLIY